MTDPHDEMATIADHRVELRKDRVHDGALRGHLPARRALRPAGDGGPDTSLSSGSSGASRWDSPSHTGSPSGSQARLIGAGRVRSHDLESAAAQLLAVARNDDRVSLVVIWESHKSTTSDSVDVTRLLSKAFERLG